jgi:hypothetical protein
MAEAIQLLPMFERKWVAKQVIQLYRGEARQVGKTTPEVEKAAENAHYDFFKGDADAN